MYNPWLEEERLERVRSSRELEKIRGQQAQFYRCLKCAKHCCPEYKALFNNGLVGKCNEIKCDYDKCSENCCPVYKDKKYTEQHSFSYFERCGVPSFHRGDVPRYPMLDERVEKFKCDFLKPKTTLNTAVSKWEEDIK